MPSIPLAALRYLSSPNNGLEAGSTYNNHTTQALFSRAVGLASTSNITCARPQPNEVGEPLFNGSSLTFHHFMILVSIPCTIITILFCVFLSWRHLHRYTAPQEQRQILRVINLPIAYAVFNTIALCFYVDYQYIQPISDVYEAFTVAAMFLLVLEYVCPDGVDREKYFDQMQNKDKKGRDLPGGSLIWFQRTWVSILQYPVSKAVFVAIQIATQYYDKFCENSFSPKYAHLWMTIADFAFIGGAINAMIAFAKRVGKEAAPEHRVKLKMYSYLGVLVFQLLFGIVFSLLNGKLFSPNKKMTYNDINFGLPALLTNVECVIFSLVFLWTFSADEYHESRRHDRYGAGSAPRTKTFKAIIDALNLSDIIAGVIVAIQLMFVRVQSRYGASMAPVSGYRNNKEGEMHLEPLSDRSRLGGYSNASDAGEQYSMPEESPYEAPHIPSVARDPSPGRARTWRGDDVLRGPMLGGQQEYEPLARSREPSPSGLLPQQVREMY